MELNRQRDGISTTIIAAVIHMTQRGRVRRTGTFVKDVMVRPGAQLLTICIVCASRRVRQQNEGPGIVAHHVRCSTGSFVGAPLLVLTPFPSAAATLGVSSRL